jgi:undecaprenyl-diphosphatase
MDIIQSIILGIIQGATEFIPVSSSGHLVLVPWALGWPSPGLFFDTMLHWGTLAAVITYFWREWLAVIRAFFSSLFGRGSWSSAPGGRLAHPDSRLAWGIILGTIPAVVLGFLFEDFFESLFGTPLAVGVFLLVTAVILTLSEKLGRRVRSLAQLNMPDALLVGLAQAASIAPGISRSGATIAAGLARGYQREDAARFSFMLSAPIIFGAGVLQLFDVVRGAEVVTSSAASVIAGTVAAGVTGYLVIRFLLNYLRRGSLYVFAVYCAIEGMIVIAASLM